MAWFERIRAIGHGDAVPTSAQDAIDIAKASAPADISGPVEAGQSVGQAVRIQTEQSGDDPVEGTLLSCSSQGIVIRRESAKAGSLNVHFPRMGQIVIAA
jgi:hypothetical protein